MVSQQYVIFKMISTTPKRRQYGKPNKKSPVMDSGKNLIKYSTPISPIFPDASPGPKKKINPNNNPDNKPPKCSFLVIGQ